MTQQPCRKSLLLVGPPGSGKGTQSRVLAELPFYQLVSMGEILRGLDPTRQPGLQIQRYLQAGEMVPADLVIDVFRHYVRTRLHDVLEQPGHALILDGVPRTVEQARLLEGDVCVHRVIHLRCDDEEALIERMRRRKTLEGRADDDDLAIIRNRFEVYHQQTQPLLDHFGPDRIISVDAQQSPLHVLAQIVNGLI